jgi:hypothetical protein
MPHNYSRRGTRFAEGRKGPARPRDASGQRPADVPNDLEPTGDELKDVVGGDDTRPHTEANTPAPIQEVLDDAKNPNIGKV